MMAKLFIFMMCVAVVLSVPLEEQVESSSTHVESSGNRVVNRFRRGARMDCLNGDPCKCPWETFIICECLGTCAIDLRKIETPGVVVHPDDSLFEAVGHDVARVGDQTVGTLGKAFTGVGAFGLKVLWHLGGEHWYQNPFFYLIVVVGLAVAVFTASWIIYFVRVTMACFKGKCSFNVEGLRNSMSIRLNPFARWEHFRLMKLVKKVPKEDFVRQKAVLQYDEYGPYRRCGNVRIYDEGIPLVDTKSVGVSDKVELQKESLCLKSTIEKIELLPAFIGTFVVGPHVVGFFSRITYKGKSALLTAAHVVRMHQLKDLRIANKDISLPFDYDWEVLSYSKVSDLDYVIFHVPEKNFTVLQLKLGKTINRLPNTLPVMLHGCHDDGFGLALGNMAAYTKVFRVKYGASTKSSWSGTPIMDLKGRICGVHTDGGSDGKYNIGTIIPGFLSKESEEKGAMYEQEYWNSEVSSKEKRRKQLDADGAYLFHGDDADAHWDAASDSEDYNQSIYIDQGQVMEVKSKGRVYNVSTKRTYGIPFYKDDSQRVFRSDASSVKWADLADHEDNSYDSNESVYVCSQCGYAQGKADKCTECQFQLTERQSLTDLQVREQFLTAVGPATKVFSDCGLDTDIIADAIERLIRRLTPYIDLASVINERKETIYICSHCNLAQENGKTCRQCKFVLVKTLTKEDQKAAIDKLMEPVKAAISPHILGIPGYDKFFKNMFDTVTQKGYKKLDVINLLNAGVSNDFEVKSVAQLENERGGIQKKNLAGPVCKTCGEPRVACGNGMIKCGCGAIVKNIYPELKMTTEAWNEVRDKSTKCESCQKLVHILSSGKIVCDCGVDKPSWRKKFEKAFVVEKDKITQYQVNSVLNTTDSDDMGAVVLDEVKLLKVVPVKQVTIVKSKETKQDMPPAYEEPKPEVKLNNGPSKTARRNKKRKEKKAMMATQKETCDLDSTLVPESETPTNIGVSSPSQFSLKGKALEKTPISGVTVSNGEHQPKSHQTSGILGKAAVGFTTHHAPKKAEPGRPSKRTSPQSSTSSGLTGLQRTKKLASLFKLAGELGLELPTSGL